MSLSFYLFSILSFYQSLVYRVISCYLLFVFLFISGVSITIYYCFLFDSDSPSAGGLLTIRDQYKVSIELH